MKKIGLSCFEGFVCKAGDCKDNCCIGWEIDIDEATLEKYNRLNGGYGDTIKNSISYDGDPHFKLCTDDRCPHLDDNGLCKIIINLGNEYICDICREHPRLYNYTDVAEVGLGMACPEAARIILSSPDYISMEEIGEVSADGEIEFNGRIMRGEVYTILSDSSLCYNKRLAKIYSDYDISFGDDLIWIKKLSELEYLDERHRNLFMNYSSSC